MTNIDHLQIGFVGAGRLGKALAWLCARRGLQVRGVASLLPSEALRWRAGGFVVHCSGATEVTVLAKAAEDGAVHALMPLVRGTLASIEQVGLGKGMPGPVSRGDVASVAKHVDALAAFDPAMLGLYREMCHRTVTIALEQRLIEAATAARVRALLA